MIAEMRPFQRKGRISCVRTAPGGLSGPSRSNFKLASSYSSLEEFGNYFQWNRDMQGYLKRNELFGGLLDCNVARAYTGDTLVNTLTTE